MSTYAWSNTSPVGQRIGDEIAAGRARLGISQREFSQRAGIDHGLFVAYESGSVRRPERSLTARNLAKIRAVIEGREPDHYPAGPHEIVVDEVTRVLAEAGFATVAEVPMSGATSKHGFCHARGHTSPRGRADLVASLLGTAVAVIECKTHLRGLASVRSAASQAEWYGHSLDLPALVAHRGISERTEAGARLAGEPLGMFCQIEHVVTRVRLLAARQGVLS